jgi:hypothetical protein
MGRKSFDVFAGFSFVESGSYQPSASTPIGVSDVLPKHGIAELPLPDRPQVGIQYVFHHRRPIDNERLALEDFPARLRSVGITSVDAPKSSKDLMYPFVGGPLFKIQIRDNSHEGVIYNQVDPDLLKGSSSEWATEDYVLLWLK